jgi:hypothetical protein
MLQPPTHVVYKSLCLVDKDKTCVNCGCTRTPFWRTERVGGGSLCNALCNACGLYLAKNDAPRPKMLWRRGSGSGEYQANHATNVIHTADADPAPANANRESNDEGAACAARTDGVIPTNAPTPR